MKKRKLFLSTILACIGFLMSFQTKACTCSQLVNGTQGGLWQAFSSYDPSTHIFSNPVAVDKSVLEGETVYYQVNDDCTFRPVNWDIDGEASYTVLWNGTVEVTWGSAGTGSILAVLDPCITPVPTALSITIVSCDDGAISEAGTGFSSGAITGSLTYPAAVNAGDVVYYKASSTLATGFEVTNGTILSVQTATGGYKVAEVEWGTAGTGTIKATNTGGGCAGYEQEITVTTPERVFDGSDDRITIPHDAAYNVGSGNFTIEAWIKANSTQNSTEATIFSKRSSTSDGIWFGLNSSGHPEIKGTSLTYLGSDLRDDAWHHIAISRTSGILLLFVDGNGLGFGSFSSDISTDSAIWIGDDNPGSDNAFTGSMKGVRFWDIAKTNTELLSTWKTNLNEFSVDMIGCWDMNEIDTQTEKDRSSTANDGYLGSNSTSSDSQDPTISPANPAPFIINALQFDGNDDRVTIEDNTAYSIGTGNFTIEAWIKSTPSSANAQTIFSKRSTAGEGIWFGLNSDGKLELSIDGSTVTSTSDDLASLNDWVHVAVTRSGTTIAFYQDGAAKGTGSIVSTRDFSTTSDIWIGNDTTNSVGFEGLIDEARLWNIARASGDIADEDSATSLAELTQTSNLKGWWRFNASVGQFDKDLSSTNNSAHLGKTDNSTAELTDPLRIADQAFVNARIGFFSASSDAASSYMTVETYPNPFAESVNLTASGLISGNATVVISDITGSEIYRTTVTDGESVMLGESLHAGIYVMTISDDVSFKTVKIIKK